VRPLEATSAPASQWLFLRGLARAAPHWGSFPHDFAEQAPLARVLCLDLPGVGSEHQRPSPRSITAITDDLRARWLAAGGLAGSWNILAISLGGMVVMDWCCRYPEDFARAVIINSSASNVAPAHRRFSLAMLPCGLRAIAAPTFQGRESAVFEMTCNAKNDLQETVSQWVELARLRPGPCPCGAGAAVGGYALSRALPPTRASARRHFPARPASVYALLTQIGRALQRQPGGTSLGWP